MIIDTLANAGTYAALHPSFAAAIEHLQGLDLAAIEVGKYEIADGLKYAVTEKEGTTAELSKFECHNKHIDIQLCISGEETIGWKPRADCHDPKGEFNEEKDVIFYNDKPDTYFQLQGGQFAIFYPEDVHAPMIGGLIKKLVVKVRI